MTSDSNPGEAYLESLLARTSKAAIEGKLTDNDRVALYRLVLTVAANEFYRIEANSGHGLVSPEVLLLIQQIALVCEDEVDQQKLLGPMGLTEEDVSDAPQVEGNGGSVEDDAGLRGSEPGSPGADEEVDGPVRPSSEGGDESS